MRALKALVMAAIMAAGFIAVYSFTSPASATVQYKKDTGKACNYCHDGSPKDKKLTPKGECFEKNKSLDGCE
jgi:hypothetical protein